MKSVEMVESGETKPSPRQGVIGLWDRFIGPGATRAENALILLWAALCTAGVVAYALTADLGWSALQLAVVALLAFDIGGGVPANAANCAKRWYHRPGQGFRELFGFPLIHVHPFALALVFPGFGWGVAAVIYVYLLVAAAVILLAPLYVKRPVAFVLYSVALLGSLYALGVPAGLEWFAPLFFLKLLVAHLLPGEAYRPYGEEAV
ncbi:MAG: hypothetical protein ACRDSJ_19015 [Rubrobacteraceae bacterium]